MSKTSIGTGETGPDTDSHIIFLTRALKAPVIREHFSRIADQAREQSWTHEQYLAAVLDRQVSAREASGTATRIAAAHFPAPKHWKSSTSTTSPQHAAT